MGTSSSSRVGGNKLGVNVAHSFNTQMYHSVLRAFTANICLDGHTTSYICPLFCQLCPKNIICRGILIDMANDLSTGITILSKPEISKSSLTASSSGLRGNSATSPVNLCSETFQTHPLLYIATTILDQATPSPA